MKILIIVIILGFNYSMFGQSTEKVKQELQTLLTLRENIDNRISFLESKYPDLIKKDTLVFDNLLDNSIIQIEKIVSEETFEKFDNLYYDIMTSGKTDKINEVVINRMLKYKNDLEEVIKNMPIKKKN